MRLRPSAPVLRRRSSGFALIIVLWTLVLIAFIVTHLTATGRTEIRIASNLVANAVVQAAADGAIFEAIFNQSDPQQDQRWPVDGKARQLTIGNSRVTLLLEDEAWWINPNSASPALLEALLRVTGSDAESARRLAGAIGEWVGSAPAPRPRNVTLPEYEAAGLDYGPPVAPLETLDELGRVLGMTPATLAAIRPHLTLFGPPAECRHHRSGRCGGARREPAGHDGFLPGPAAPRCAHHADHRDRVQPEQRARDPLRHRPSWTRAAQWLRSARLGQRLLMRVS